MDVVDVVGMFLVFGTVFGFLATICKSTHYPTHWDVKYIHKPCGWNYHFCGASICPNCGENNPLLTKIIYRKNRVNGSIVEETK